MIIEKNMDYNVIFNDQKLLDKDFSKIPYDFLKNIFDKIDYLSKNWLCKNSQIKKLNYYDLCDYRLRVWDYRILFNLDIENKEIIIFRILHRSKLY